MSQVVKHAVGERLLVVEELERQLDSGGRDAGGFQRRLPFGGGAGGHDPLDAMAKRHVMLDLCRAVGDR